MGPRLDPDFAPLGKFFYHEVGGGRMREEKPEWIPLLAVVPVTF
jgi:hypothetical protein